MSFGGILLGLYVAYIFACLIVIAKITWDTHWMGKQ